MNSTSGRTSSETRSRSCWSCSRTSRATASGSGVPDVGRMDVSVVMWAERKVAWDASRKQGALGWALARTGSAAGEEALRVLRNAFTPGAEPLRVLRNAFAPGAEPLRVLRNAFAPGAEPLRVLRNAFTPVAWGGSGGRGKGNPPAGLMPCRGARERSARTRGCRPRTPGASSARGPVPRSGGGCCCARPWESGRRDRRGRSAGRALPRSAPELR
jgi:hypothetical protein